MSIKVMIEDDFIIWDDFIKSLRNIGISVKMDAVYAYHLIIRFKSQEDINLAITSGLIKRDGWDVGGIFGRKRVRRYIVCR